MFLDGGDLRVPAPNPSHQAVLWTCAASVPIRYGSRFAGTATYLMTIVHFELRYPWPMSQDERFVVIAAGGGGKNGTPSSDAIVAFALPDAETAPRTSAAVACPSTG